MLVDKTLKERRKTHGDFNAHSKYAQDIKETMRQGNWDKLSNDKKEALEMIAHKVARVLSGNENHVDHWHDIAGYSTLIEKEITKKEKEKQKYRNKENEDQSSEKEEDEE